MLLKISNYASQFTIPQIGYFYTEMMRVLSLCTSPREYYTMTCYKRNCR